MKSLVDICAINYINNPKKNDKEKRTIEELFMSPLQIINNYDHKANDILPNELWERIYELRWYNEKYCIEMIKKDSFNIQYTKIYTKEFLEFAYGRPLDMELLIVYNKDDEIVYSHRIINPNDTSVLFLKLSPGWSKSNWSQSLSYMCPIRMHIYYSFEFRKYLKTLSYRKAVDEIRKFTLGDDTSSDDDDNDVAFQMFG
jgi:hypothetical protein